VACRYSTPGSLAITAAGVQPYAGAEAVAALAVAPEPGAVAHTLDKLAAYRPAATAIGWANAKGDEHDAQAAAREGIAQADLLRDLFASPFRPTPVLGPTWLAWNDGLVKRLAEDAYEERLLPSGELDGPGLLCWPTLSRMPAAPTPSFWLTCGRRGRM
jgi:hypothetical protein